MFSARVLDLNVLLTGVSPGQLYSGVSLNETINRLKAGNEIYLKREQGGCITPLLALLF